MIDTDYPIPGTLRADAAALAGDALRIRWRPAIAAPAEQRPIWCHADALWFDPPGVARYRCTPRAIEITPIAGAARDDIDGLLVATALPAVLWLQEALVLHAAAIVPRDGDRAIAIAGASGSGKSRLAAALLADGARLVADDSIAIGWRQDRPVCAGLAGGYHLSDAADTPRLFFPVPAPCRSAALAAVVVLDDAPAYARLRGVEAIRTMLANRHRASVPRLCGLEARRLPDIVRLAREVPVYRWSASEADALLDDAVRNKILRDGDEG